MEWQPIATAPFGCDLELATLSSATGMHALVFPCRRVQNGWVKTETNMPVTVYPTHWRKWTESPSPLN
jgi:hypothetical protein